MSKIKSIPYMGSKNKIARWVLDNMVESLDKTQPYNLIDVFGGGGAITTTAVEEYPLFSKVQYNELNKGVYELFKLLTLGAAEDKENFFKETKKWVTREQFMAEKDLDTAWGGYIKTCWSFGNGQKSYLYGKNIEGVKKLAHEMVVNLDVEAAQKLGLTFGKEFWEEPVINKRRLMFYKTRREAEKRLDLQHLERLQHLTQLQHLERLQHLTQLQHLERLQHLTQLQHLVVSNLSYENITPTSNTVLYCDAPYNNTEGYQAGFDHEEYHEWLQNQTLNNIPVFVSEYGLEISGYEVIAIKEKRSTRGGNKPTVEKLFWNGIK